ncbi:hypothetical protein DSM104299_01739 [Baekduia alba]|uniref:hypothetical protein n=1 Tax=Baekduia alba TaxID=2997333 RepID=UPI0023422C59|nr:hypothetical protein [Baekduia alba]WCB93037.1 hypothetical protein DSM104299_01739 [Baekduia alba]
MTRKNLLPILALATTAIVPTTSALAAGSDHTATIPATKASIKIESGYAYYDSFKPSNKRLIVVVVKTHGEAPRRFDGLIRAGGSLSGHHGGSVGSVGGKQSKCYTFTVPLKDGHFYTKSGGKGAKGSPGKYLAVMSAKDKDGNTVSSTKVINLRDRKVGDRVGKPLSC